MTSDVACEMPPPEATEREVRVRSGFVAVAILLMAASFILVKTGRDALYFQERGLFDLPKAYIGIALLSVPFAFGTLALMRLMGPRVARVVTPLCVAVLFGLAAFEITAGGGVFNTAMFVAIPLSYGVLFSLSWLLGADLLDDVRGPRLAMAYGVIGSGSIIGGVLGGIVAKALSGVVEPRALMWVGSATLAVAALSMWGAQARYPAHKIRTPARTGDVAGSGVFAALRQRYALLLLVVAMTASLTGIFVEFQFYLAAAASQNTAQQNAAFFANFYIILNGGALVVQLYLMPRLQRVLGVHGSLLIMPVAILGGAALAIGNSSVLVRSGLKVTEGGLKASIHRSNWEQAFLALSSDQRAAAKLIIDGAAARVAEGLAAVALYVWLVTSVGDGVLQGRSTAWLTYMILGTAVAWIAVTWVLGRGAKGRDAGEMRNDIPLPDT